MAGFTAIAGVSVTLRNLLRDRMENPVDVTIAPPDATISGMDGNRLNLYLYQVRENEYLKNQEIPGSGHPAAYGHPPLSLDLDYLMTAYGADDTGVDVDLQAQRTLGDAMRVFHDYPIITPTLHENDNPGDPLILEGSLVGEFERIKIALHPSTLEDLTKVWSVLPSTAFRRSVAYQVSVVQIESTRPRQVALPVRRRAVYAFPLSTPHVAEVFREPPFDGVRSAVAESGDTVVIVGHKLAGLATRLKIGASTINVTNPSSRRIEVALPSAIRAGIHAVRVSQALPFEGETGQPPVLHRGFESNSVPLLLLPRVTGVAPAAAGPGDHVGVSVAPPVDASQRRSILVGDREIPAIAVLPGSPPSATINFALPTGSNALAPGNYLVRARVDGSESRLSVNPGTGAYDGPSLTVTS